MMRYTDGRKVVDGPFGTDCLTPLERWLMLRPAWIRWQERGRWQRLVDKLRRTPAPPDPGARP